MTADGDHCAAAAPLFIDDDLGGGVLTEVVDCRKTIFILTSNFLDHEISRFERLNAERVAEAARLAEQGEDNEVLAGLMDDFQVSRAA